MRGIAMSIVVCAATNGAVAGEHYTIRDIGSLPGGFGTYANGINREGHVAGDSYLSYDNGTIDAPDPVYYHHGHLDALGGTGSAEAINDDNHLVGFMHNSLTSPDYHAFFHKRGQTQDLGTLPGDQDSVAYGINDDDKVVGYSANDHIHAFVFDGAMHPIGALPGDTDSVASGINNRGQIVGLSYKTVQVGDAQYAPGRAFLYEHGHMHEIGAPPNDNASAAAAINEAGLIVGSANYQTPTYYGPSHAFLYDGTMHDLGTLGGPQSFAAAINQHGVIVGSSEIPGDPSNPQSDAFVYRDGVMYDLNDLVNLSRSGWTQLYQANGINERGQITGWGFNGDGLRSFVLTPVSRAIEDLAEQTTLGDAAMAKSMYAAGDSAGTCSMLAAVSKDLRNGTVDGAQAAERQSQWLADVAAIANAVGCDRPPSR